MIKHVLAMTLLGVLLFSSCATQKTTTKSLEKATYSQPGMDVLEKNRKGKFRTWAVGISDSEMTARSKAMALASAELAEMVGKAVKTTVDDYSVTLSEGEVSKSKTLMNKQFNITVNQVLQGAVPIYDKWAPKDENGMYRNYIVLELNGKSVVDALYKDYVANESNTTKVDKTLLDELFLEAVNK